MPWDRARSKEGVVERDGLDTYVAARPHDSDGDLTSIGDQHFVEHGSSSQARIWRLLTAGLGHSAQV
jgi:hypothetical protein